MSDLLTINSSALDGELDLKFGEEKAENYVYKNLTTSDGNQVDPNIQRQHGSPLQPADFRYENSGSYDKSHFVPTEFDDDDVRTKKIAYEQERTKSSSNDNYYQGGMDELHGSYFHKCSFQFKAQAFPMGKGTEDSAHSQEFPLTADANQVEEMEGNPDFDRPNTAPRDEKKEKSNKHDSGPDNDNYYSSRNSPVESRKLDLPPSDPHSFGSNPSTSPVAVRMMSVSSEGSPCTLQSPNGHKPLSLQEGVQNLPHSPISCGQIHTSSPERTKLNKGVPPQEHLFPSSRQTSASPQRSCQGSRHKDGSSLKRKSASPKPRYSPEIYQRRDRSVSRSPIRRRDSSSRYKRDYHGRSRSRSPSTRDRHKSPRRGYSPRRRSSPSGYHSHHRSPRRKPWSPPPNRRTGVGKPGKNLFVAGFSFLTTEKDLERKFSRFGRVRDVRIVRDKRSGDSRGFGFLSLEKDEDADAAIRALDETEWNGRVILVEKSKSMGR